MVLFDDFNRSAQDLFNNDFCHEKPWAIDFKHRLKNPSFGFNLALHDKGIVKGSSVTRYGMENGQLEMRLGTTESNIKGYYSIATLPNLTFRFLHTQNDDCSKSTPACEPPKESTCAAMEYQHRRSGAHLRMNINPLNGNWSVSSAVPFAITPHILFHLGSFCSGSRMLTGTWYSLAVAATQKTDRLTITGALKSLPQKSRMFETLVGTISVRDNSDGGPEYAVQMKRSLSTGTTQLSCAGLWYLDQSLDDPLRRSMIKLKISHDAKLSAVLKQRISDTLTTSIGAQMTLTQKSLQPLKYGVKFDLTA